jgi:hypothetical protein
LFFSSASQIADKRQRFSDFFSRFMLSHCINLVLFPRFALWRSTILLELAPDKAPRDLFT